MISSAIAAALRRIRQKRRKLFCAAILYICSKKKEKRWAVHPINKARKQNGIFYTLFPTLERDEEKFKAYFRYS